MCVLSPQKVFSPNNILYTHSHMPDVLNILQDHNVQAALGQLEVTFTYS